MLLPPPAFDLGHVLGRGLSHTLNAIGEVPPRPDTLRHASRDQDSQDASASGIKLLPANAPDLGSHRYRPQSMFMMLDADRCGLVGQEHHQPGRCLRHTGSGTRPATRRVEDAASHVNSRRTDDPAYRGEICGSLKRFNPAAAGSPSAFVDGVQSPFALNALPQPTAKPVRPHG